MSLSNSVRSRLSTALTCTRIDGPCFREGRSTSGAIATCLIRRRARCRLYPARTIWFDLRSGAIGPGGHQHAVAHRGVVVVDCGADIFSSASGVTTASAPGHFIHMVRGVLVQVMFQRRRRRQRVGAGCRCCRLLSTDAAVSSITVNLA